MTPPIHVIPVLNDNFAYILDAGDGAVVIDPGEAEPVIMALGHLGLMPRRVLVTHYDYDHVDGIGELRDRFDVEVIGPVSPGFPVDRTCYPGEVLSLGLGAFQVIDTPGHAFPHVAYYAAGLDAVFSGDCLFGAGCGRVRGDAYRDMWDSLCRIAALPDATRVYFGHEYTLDNLDFAAHIEPGNPAIAARRSSVEAAISRGGWSVPSTLAEERQTNPFLRTGHRGIRRKLGLGDVADVEVFEALRKAKNCF